MEDPGKMKKVLCPVSIKGDKTVWLRMGTAFVNKDASISLYLDALPINGKLQIREWDDGPAGRRDEHARPRLAAVGGGAGVPVANEELPF